MGWEPQSGYIDVKSHIICKCTVICSLIFSWELLAKFHHFYKANVPVRNSQLKRVLLAIILTAGWEDERII